MAVEDHPKFPEWKDALEALIIAKEKLRSVKHLPNGTGEKTAAQVRVYLAQLEYDKISDSLN